MDYLTVAEGREATGLRLVLTRGVPGPWGQSAKALFRIRNMPIKPVAQALFEPNEELVAWTGSRNAPVVIYEDEPAIHDWLSIIMLAERLGSGPSILPDSSAERALSLGISAEICAPGGFGWTRRLSLIGSPFGLGELPAEAPPHLVATAKEYGYSASVAQKGPARVADILSALAAQLDRQRANGSKYLVGNRVSACDIHWACFSMLVAPLPLSDAPMPDQVRASFSDIEPPVKAALVDALIEHRDYIYDKYIGLPVEC